jgi:putative N6-adenine-specific DNA methylase
VAGKAPLNEVLAAALVYLSGWNPPRPLYNPMCGSGTIGIEAALLAANVPPGVFRDSFAFQNWKNFDSELYTLISEKLLDRIKEDYVKIHCSDIESESALLTNENRLAAKVEDLVSFEKLDFFKSTAYDGPGTVIINPPYNERLEMEDEIGFYKQIGDTLKRNYPGCTAWVLTANLDAAKFIGLRPSRKIALFNGQLECRFLRFDLYEGKKKYE